MFFFPCQPPFGDCTPRSEKVGPKLKIVIGICDGYSYIFDLGKDTTDFFGYNVNVASKLAKMVGKPGQILISNDFLERFWIIYEKITKPNKISPVDAAAEK